MVCDECIKRQDEECRLNPEAVPIQDTHNHWCAQGVWHQWSERYQEMEPFYWGEWEEAV
jgi:hypothetical protein